MLKTLLPRALSAEAGNETVTLFNALIARIHLDRRLSRRLGFRGVRPSFSHGSAWTVRLAQSTDIFGIAFIDEDSEGDIVAGRFTLYRFPAPDSAGVAALTSEKKAIVTDREYLSRIRELSANTHYFEAFACAELELLVTISGDALALTVIASAQKGFNDFTCVCPLLASVTEAFRHETKHEGELVLSTDTQDGTVSLSFVAGNFEGKLPGKRLRKLYFAHQPKPDELQDLPVVHVLTGFLGAGKTTFLRQWLEYLNGRERFTGVIQNEFGQVDLDSLVLAGQTRVEALDDGCVCCSLADSLRPGILRLMETTPAEQFVLETTGVADPVNVLYSLLALNDLVKRGLLITVVDGWTLTQNPQALSVTDDEDAKCRLSQVLNADVLVVSKADLVDEPHLEHLMQRLHELNNQALVVGAFHGAIPFAVLDNFYYHWLDTEQKPLPSQQSPKTATPETSTGFAFKRTFKPIEPTANEFETVTIEIPNAVTENQLSEIIQTAGTGLRRAKGIVNIQDEGLSVVQFASGLLSYEPATEDMLEKWSQTSGAEPVGFFVLIGHGIATPAGFKIVTSPESLNTPK